MGAPVESASVPLDTTYTPDGRAEQDPDEIYRSVLAATADVVEKLEKAAIPRTDIRCVGIANQRETFVASDFDGLFPTPVPITALIGDSHAAFVGERCFNTGDAKATIGTGCSVLLGAGSQPPPPYPSTMLTVGFSLRGRTEYALEGIIVSAGSVLTWLQREQGLYDDAGELEGISTGIEDAGGVVVVPGHAGLGAPFWRMGAQGSIHGLSFATGKAHIVRAALEAIPFQIRAILDAVKLESGTSCSSLRVDGGISANRFVVQLLADTLGVPVLSFGVADVTARGAAFLAGIGAGIFPDVKAIEALPLDETAHHPGDGE